MEESGDTVCSKTMSDDSNKYEEEYEEEEEDDIINNKPEEESSRKKAVKDGGSSSNSTVEESSEKKGSVRPYVRSKMPRLRWTPDLHLRFIHAVERLGGQERATPKLVLQLMDIKGLNISHVKSHLQMYRSKKIEDPSQGFANHRLFMEGGDRNVFNLSQLPMFKIFNNQRLNPPFRYSDDSYRNCQEKWMNERFRSSNNYDLSREIINPRFSERSNQPGLHELKEKLGSFLENQTWHNKMVHSAPQQNPIHQQRIQVPTQAQTTTLLNRNAAVNLVKQATMKRKAVDLNLSLGMKWRDDEKSMEGLGEDESGLSLSLSSSSSSKLRKLNEDESNNNNFIMKYGKGGASTLDLTL